MRALNKKLKDRHIILGSGSPRRQQFLKDLGLTFEVQKKPVQEKFPDTLKAEAIPAYLARLKAEPYLEILKEKDLLITGDTIVWFEDEVIHKPKNQEEAFRMLKRLSGQKHEVISSVCLTTTQKFKLVTDKTNVFFHNLSDSEIQFYIEHFQPFDKAGGYGIQEWIGKIGIQRIEGSFYTVMGMPIDKVYRALVTF